MARPGAAQRARLRQGLPGVVKPGRIGWVRGRKEVFMRSFKDEYLAAALLGKVAAGRFYDGVGDKYIKIFGYMTPWNGDLDAALEVALDVNPDEDEDDILPEEAKRRSDYFNVLRTKIQHWFRQEYGAGAKNKAAKGVTFKRLFGATQLEVPEPSRARVTHFYSRRYYNERIKSRFMARWAALSKSRSPPAPITVQNAVIKEAWEGETEPFKAEVKAALEAEYAAAKAAYDIAVSGETPKTPEEYQIAQDNAAYYLEPFINAIAERFGMNVSLLMCGPVPERGGAIEMLSIHCGRTRGVVPRIWPDFDRAGFEALRRSFREFTEKCFSTEERRGRSLNGMAEAEVSANAPDGTVTDSLHAPPPVPETDESGEASGSGGGGDEVPEDEGGDGDQLPEDEDVEEDDDDEDDEEEGGRWARSKSDRLSLAKRMGPEVTAEHAAMEAGKKRWDWETVMLMSSPYDMEREENMAKTKRLFREALGENAPGAPAPAPPKKKARTKNKEQVSKGSPRRTRGRARIEAGNETGGQGAGEAEDLDDEGDKDDDNDGGEGGEGGDGADSDDYIDHNEGAEGDGDENDGGDNVIVPMPRKTLSDLVAQAKAKRAAGKGPRPAWKGATGTETAITSRSTMAAPLTASSMNDAGNTPSTASTASSTDNAPDMPSTPTLARSSSSFDAAATTSPPANSLSTENAATTLSTALTTPTPVISTTPVLTTPTPVMSTTPATTNSAAVTPAASTGSVPAAAEAEGEGTVWQAGEVRWPQELKNALGGCGRFKAEGGGEWEECVAGVIALEKAWGFPEKGLLATPGGRDGRPSEVALFMKTRRKWEEANELEKKGGVRAAPGPRDVAGSMSQRFWAWWELFQPEGRFDEEGNLRNAADVSEDAWDEVAKTHGRNGMLMVLGCLLWWGEAAAASEDPSPLLEDWKLAVVDVTSVLTETLKGVGALVDRVGKDQAKEDKERGRKEKGKGGRKRKAVSSAADEEKENGGRWVQKFKTKA
ncbi:hypothetical protein C8R43DRAFT_1134082 [Mycena crocata]|nr:hypothetical protein C8R43DRAFT_1134082 [Mycena crocata]